MTTLAATILDDFTSGASRHTSSETMLLCPFTYIWLIRALHLFLRIVGCDGVMQSRVHEASRHVEVGTHAYPSHMRTF